MQNIRQSTTLAALLLTFSSSAFAQEESPRDFRINNIRSQGTGCPQGTVGSNISDDREAFTVTYSQFQAEVSPATGRQQDRKNCRLVFDTEQDPTWEYAVMAVTYRGYAMLEEGVTGSQTLRFGRNGREDQTVMSLRGAYDDNYINTQEVGLGNLKWSGCANRLRDFTINASIELSAPDAQHQGLFTVDSTDGEVKQEYEVLWRPCGSSGRKFVGICRLLVEVPGRHNTRQLFTKAVARNEASALNKARNKMARKCQRGNRARSCDASQASCEVLAF